MLPPDVRAGDPIPQTVDLKEIIIQLSHSDEVLLPDFISGINLDVFGEEAVGLLERTTADPDRLERGKRVLVTQDKRVLIDKQDLVGTKTSDGQQIDISFNPFIDINSKNRKDRLNLHLATIIHTHPHSFPPSIEDLSRVLLSPHEISSLTMAYIISEEAHTLVFRGPQTPRLSEDQVNSFLTNFNSILVEYVRKYIESGFNPFEANKMVQEDVFKKVVELYGLRVFSCAVEDQIAKRVIFE